MKSKMLSNAGSLTWKLGKLLALAVAMAILAFGFMVGWTEYQNRQWPQFPALEDRADPTPQALIKVERDYAYRTGDLIHLKLFIKQMPGTMVDTRTLSLGEVFEEADKPSVTVRKFRDGSVVYRIDLTVQSFYVSRELPFTGSIAWKKGEVRGDLKLPVQNFYTSNTYDGRKNLMEGGDPRVSKYWYGARFVVSMLLGLLVYVLLLVPAVRAWLASRIKQVKIDHRRKRVIALLDLVREGSCTKEQHLELDGLVRDQYHVGPVPVSQLEVALVPPSVIAFLKLNEPAIYSPDTLDEKGRADLLAKAEVVLKVWKEKK